MMEKFKTPLPQCSRCTKLEAHVISIQTKQKAFCGLISPAPGPLPPPQPPWQQENIWESALQQSIRPGGRPITASPQQSGPARSTPPGLDLFINSHLLSCHQEANVALTQPLTYTCFHFPSHSSAISPPSPHFVLLFQSLHHTHLVWQCPPPSYSVHWLVGLLGVWGRGGRGPSRGLACLSCFLAEREQGRQSLSGDFLSRAGCPVASACVK